MSSGLSGMSVGRLPDSRDDTEVSAAAADIAVHVTHDFVARGIGSLGQQRHARDDHAGRTIAALHGALLQEGVLERVMDSLDGGDVFAGSRADWKDAGAYGLAVEQDGTS